MGIILESALPVMEYIKVKKKEKMGLKREKLKQSTPLALAKEKAT